MCMMYTYVYIYTINIHPLSLYIQTTPCLSDVVFSLTHSELALLAACCRLHLSPSTPHMKLTVGDMTRIYDQFTGILTRKVSDIYYIIRCTTFLYMHAIFLYAYNTSTK